MEAKNIQGGRRKLFNWRMAEILGTVITNKIIAKLGYISLLDYYLRIYEN